MADTPRRPSYRLVGGDTLPRPHRVNVNASMARPFRHGSTAAAVTNIDRTLGASTRQGWRLSCSAEERAAHGAVTTRNNVTLGGLDPDPRPVRRVVK